MTEITTMAFGYCVPHDVRYPTASGCPGCAAEQKPAEGLTREAVEWIHPTNAQIEQLLVSSNFAPDDWFKWWHAVAYLRAHRTFLVEQLRLAATADPRFDMGVAQRICDEVSK